MTDLDSLTLAAFKLVGYMSLTVKACADVILDQWPSLSGKPARPAVSYFVYSQFMFLYLHVMDRMAFADGGDWCRVAVRDAITPHLIPALNGYLKGRHTPEEPVPSSTLHASGVSNDFYEMLNKSELSFSGISDYHSMIEEVIERFKEAWELTDIETLAQIVRREAGTRGHNLKSLLSVVIQYL